MTDGTSASLERTKNVATLLYKCIAFSSSPHPFFSCVLTYLINGFVLLEKTKNKTKHTETHQTRHREQYLKYMVYTAENVCFDFLLLRQK